MEITNDEEILQAIVKKAWRDPIFKSDLIATPVVTIENFLGHQINLSVKPNMDDMEHNDN